MIIVYFLEKLRVSKKIIFLTIVTSLYLVSKNCQVKKTLDFSGKIFLTKILEGFKNFLGSFFSEKSFEKFFSIFFSQK